MPLTLEILKNDELRLTADLGQVSGALTYNKQLQAFLANEESPTPDVQLPPLTPEQPQ